MGISAPSAILNKDSSGAVALYQLTAMAQHRHNRDATDTAQTDTDSHAPARPGIHDEHLLTERFLKACNGSAS